MRGMHSAAFCFPTCKNWVRVDLHKNLTTRVLFAGGQKDKALRLGDTKHERFDFELRPSAYHRIKIDAEYAGKFTRCMIML